MENIYKNDASREFFSLHDPITILSVIHPEMIEWKKSTIDVSTDPIQFGRTIDTNNPEGSVHIATKIDQEAAKTRIAQIIAAN